jgi:hypothetical protein
VSVGRGAALLLAFGALAVVGVHLRAEETRLASRVQRLRRERIELRRESWALQMEIARVRTPQQIRGRVDRWCLEVRLPPIEDDTTMGRDLAAR